MRGLRRQRSEGLSCVTYAIALDTICRMLIMNVRCQTVRAFNKTLPCEEVFHEIT